MKYSFNELFHFDSHHLPVDFTWSVDVHLFFDWLFSYHYWRYIFSLLWKCVERMVVCSILLCITVQAVWSYKIAVRNVFMCHTFNHTFHWLCGILRCVLCHKKQLSSVLTNIFHKVDNRMVCKWMLIKRGKIKQTCYCLQVNEVTMNQLPILSATSSMPRRYKGFIEIVICTVKNILTFFTLANIFIWWTINFKFHVTCKSCCLFYMSLSCMIYYCVLVRNGWNCPCSLTMIRLRVCAS